MPFQITHVINPLAAMRCGNDFEYDIQTHYTK